MATCFKFNRFRGGYSWRDFEVMDRGVEYATEVLQIPHESLEMVLSFYGSHIVVLLKEDPAVMQTSWYRELQPFAA